MQINQIPHIDLSDNPTGCCARFDPEGWDGVELQFRDKPFARAQTRSVLHVPVNMGKVFTRVLAKLELQGTDPDNYIVLSRDPSPWKGEHLFASNQPLEGEEMTTLTGDFVTKVFEGGYSDAGEWMEELKTISASHGKPEGDSWLFYTTCPKCAKAYGKNYVVGLAEI